MGSSKMRDNIERWLIHESLSFDEISNSENNFHIIAKHAGQFGIPIEVFEPKAQPGVLVIGAKIAMKNNQIARYQGFNEYEKEKFEKKVSDFCYSIQAVNKMITEDGKQKIGVYVVLDERTDVNQQTFFEAIKRVSEMHEKTSRFSMKTF